MLLIHTLINHYKKSKPWLYTALALIPYLPIKVRKELVVVMQLGMMQESLPDAVNSHRPYLHKPHSLFGVYGTPLLGEDVVRIYEPVLNKRAVRSLIWMFARTLQEPSTHMQAQQITLDGFYKEFGASQSEFHPEQVKDYSPLHGLPSLRDLPEYICRDLQRIATSFANKLNRIGTLYPSVQRNKNISQESAVLYEQHVPNVRHVDVTTRDLEVLRARSHVVIQGACEMRKAWKFNDLKPRLYYCMGGRDYFLSRYFKKIAQTLMDSIPTTETKVRTFPEHYLSQDFENDYVVTWDFESFTTRLSELKYFLYNLSLALRDQAVHELRLFDYELGEVLVHPADLLDEYNDQINVQSPFSIHRIVHACMLACDPTVTYHQQNSGMLGVPGNIGFSTGLHGYHILEIFGRRGVGVGDDAKGVTRKNPVPDITQEIAQLGAIHPDKFGISNPGSYDPYRFLKRAFYRNVDGSFYKESLLVFPLAPLIDGEMSHRDYFGSLEPVKIRDKVIAQVGALLWSMKGDYELYEEDMEIIRIYLERTYSMLELPYSGCLPGFRNRYGGDTVVMKKAVPSIEFKLYDPRVIDWVDHLLRYTNQAEYLVPIPVHKGPLSWHTCGEEVLSYVNPIWSAFEDLGIVKTKPAVEKRLVLSETDKRDIKRAIGQRTRGVGSGVLVTFLEDIPDRFNSFFIDHSFSVNRYAISGDI